MTKARPAPETPSSPAHYFRLRQGKAAKLSPHAKGMVSYDLLTDAQRSDVFIAIIDSDSTAYFSRQPISVSEVESVVSSISTDKPLSASAFRQLYVNRSSNNGGFLACALVGEGLLGRVPDKAHGLVNRENWGTWKDACLAAATDDMEVVTFGPKPASEAEPSNSNPNAASDDNPSASQGEPGKPGKPGEAGEADARPDGKARRHGKVKE